MGIGDLRARRPWVDATLRLQLPFFLKVKLQVEVLRPAEEVEVPVERPDDEPAHGAVEASAWPALSRTRAPHSNAAWTPRA